MRGDRRQRLLRYTVETIDDTQPVTDTKPDIGRK